jgi:hypothetical protein
MGGSVFALDTILSAMNFHARRWSPDLTRTQSRDLLRFLTIKLYGEGKGSLQGASFTISQSALADKIGVCREWCNKLLAQLKNEGWISYTSTYEQPCKRTPCTYVIGNTMRRLLIMLTKSRSKKNKQNPVVNSRSQVSPLFSKERKPFYPPPRNNEKRPEIVDRDPLLKMWMDRGRQKQNEDGAKAA